MTEPNDNLVEELARVIANGLGFDFDEAVADKTEWITLRGEKGGRFHDINEPMQCDYTEAANLVSSIIITRLEEAAYQRGLRDAAAICDEVALGVDHDAYGDGYGAACKEIEQRIRERMV